MSVIGWMRIPVNLNTRQKAIETMERYSQWGLKGAKIDFFDHNTLDENPGIGGIMRIRNKV